MLVINIMAWSDCDYKTAKDIFSKGQTTHHIALSIIMAFSILGQNYGQHGTKTTSTHLPYSRREFVHTHNTLF